MVLLIILRRETKKGNFIFVRLLFCPNYSCASYAGIFFFSVNIELAQKKYVVVHKEGWMRLGNKRWGDFISMQYITSALKRTKTREYYTASACKHTLSTQHIHTHTCAHILNKALLQRQNGSWMNPVLFFGFWFIVNLSRATWANHCAAFLACWVWHFIHRILPSNG